MDEISFNIIYYGEISLTFVNTRLVLLHLESMSVKCIHYKTKQHFQPINPTSKMWELPVPLLSSINIEWVIEYQLKSLM